jgi:hypothetical protein
VNHGGQNSIADSLATECRPRFPLLPHGRPSRWTYP